MTKINIFPLVNQIAQLVIDHEELNRLSHEYAMTSVGLPVRDMTDEDENEPWYAAYWLHVVEFQGIVMTKVTSRIQNDHLVACFDPSAH